MATCIHLFIQIGLLLGLLFYFGVPPNRYWIWLPYILVMEIIFVCGLSLLTSAMHVYMRDTRYLVEVANTILFWMVPISYDFSAVPRAYGELYKLNPLAALILALRDILLKAQPPCCRQLVNKLLAALALSPSKAVFEALCR